MFSLRSLRIGATAARALTYGTVTKSAANALTATTATALVSNQVSLGVFRTGQPVRSFVVATVLRAAATTTAGETKKTTKTKKSKKTKGKKMASASSTKAKGATKKKTAAGDVTKKTKTTASEKAAAVEKKKAAADKKKATAAKKKVAAAKAAEVAKKKKAAAKIKAMTPEEKTKLRVRELKKAALLKEPAKLPEHPWILFIAEKTKGVKTADGARANLGKIMPELSQEFKALSPQEVQRLRDTADQNRGTNAKDYEAWVESHTAAQTVAANRARTRLNRIANTRRRLIHDARIPKRPTSSFSIFTKERWATNELSGRPLAEAARTLATEWKSLPATERQHYDDLAKTLSEKYTQEMVTILGRPVSQSPSPTPSSP
ncbi:hypothetical protein SEPCBS57363_001556 [Sporothrix epigloea]|uniref:HMG box domain-containing protein n=1 Tax=Sporothrix epigloea TaxID=1892477 RepID=A0ABP0DB75_9PEZI